MSVDRIVLQPGYSISRIIKGGWHLAGGHGHVDEKMAIGDMKKFVEAGITTFDCADIYTGVEELIGKFLKTFNSAFKAEELPSIQIHTKYVPDRDKLGSIRKEDTTKIIDRSLSRLGVEQLDLVQFAWWDYDHPNYVETAYHLQELQDEGKIRFIGVTNFDTERVTELVEAGIKIIANQVQYSVLDHRVEYDQPSKARSLAIPMLCYGSVAGGYLSDRYLDQLESDTPENRSLIKYRLIIDEFGGYPLFQKLLKLLKNIALKYDVGIAEIACRYILQKPNVGAVIVGARNSNHIDSLLKLSQFELGQEDLKQIQQLLNESKGPKGPFYQLEREKGGKHAAIMRYNLNNE